MARLSTGRSIRVLRRARGWRQADLARVAGVSQPTVSRAERDQLDGLTVGSLRACVAALDGFVALEVRWRGTALDALADAGHAALQDWTARVLEQAGWETRVETSFNQFGDRGRYDVLGFNRASGVLLAVEVKTAIEDAQEMLGRLDVKVRVARRVVAEFGWRPVAVVPLLVIADGRTAQRRIAQHAALFRRYAVRGRPALAWLRHPSGEPPTGLLVLVRAPVTREASTKRG